MPVFESCCVNPDCERDHLRFEWYASTMDKPNPSCEACGALTVRMVSSFAAPFTGDLERMNDPSKDRYSQLGGGADGGHFAYRVKSSRRADGAPERVLIRTRADQRAFTAAEGLHMPDDIGPNIEVSDDGCSVSSQGMPGSWGGNPASMPQETTLKAKPKPSFGGVW